MSHGKEVVGVRSIEIGTERGNRNQNVLYTSAELTNKINKVKSYLQMLKLVNLNCHIFSTIDTVR